MIEPIVITKEVWENLTFCLWQCGCWLSRRPTWNEIYDIYWLPTVREASQTLSRDLQKATNDEY